MFGEKRDKYPGERPEKSLLDVALESIRDAGVEVVPYKLWAEITTAASSFLANIERNLIVRLHVPGGKLWSIEADKFLQLFQDYLTRLGRFAVRLDYKKTAHGSVYEFHGERGGGQLKLTEDFTSSSI